MLPSGQAANATHPQPNANALDQAIMTQYPAIRHTHNTPARNVNINAHGLNVNMAPLLGGKGESDFNISEGKKARVGTHPHHIIQEGFKMNRFQEYEQDIFALERVFDEYFDEYFGPDVDEQQLDEFAKEFKKITAPLHDGTVDPGDLENVRESYWSKFGPSEVERAKKEVAIHRKLRELYEYLGAASEDEWAAFARMRVNAKFQENSILIKLLLKVSEPLEDANSNP